MRKIRNKLTDHHPTTSFGVPINAKVRPAYGIKNDYRQKRGAVHKEVI